MSSYLNIYLVPKENKKPLLFNSYSRNTEVYQYFYEDLHPTFGEGYSDLTVDGINRVIRTCENDIQKYKKEYNDRYEILKHNLTLESVEELIQWKRAYQDLEDELVTLKNIHEYIDNISVGYTDFEKVVMNVG